MLNKSLIQGSLSMLILRLLDEKDMYGYEMIETLRKRSENVFELKAGIALSAFACLRGKQSCYGL